MIAVKEKKKTGPKGPSRYTLDYVNQLADELLTYAETDHLPFLKKFALMKRIPPQAFTDSKEFSENQKFSEALKIAKGWSEQKLFEAGLRKEVDNSTCIFGLKNIAGWRDKQEVEHSGNMTFTDLLRNANNHAETKPTANRLN
ncbi:MAG TPA: hypothetical protein V6D12_14105 [Candidatus Obscuribacterales bacterium]